MAKGFIVWLERRTVATYLVCELHLTAFYEGQCLESCGFGFSASSRASIVR